MMRWSIRTNSTLEPCRFATREVCLERIKEWRRDWPGNTYKLVRLVTKLDKVVREMQDYTRAMLSPFDYGYVDATKRWLEALK